MNKLLSLILCGFVLTLATQLTQAAVLPLESRLGGLAYYDPNLDITWAADANINGADSWANQQTWAASLTIGGVSGWRLPNADVNGDGTIECRNSTAINCTDNEMGFLYWEQGITAVNPGPFSNVQAQNYWFDTAINPNNSWIINYNSGGTGLANNSFTTPFAWAVNSGDVSAVPVPAAVWLFSSGLVGLLGLARRQR